MVAVSSDITATVLGRLGVVFDDQMALALYSDRGCDPGQIRRLRPNAVSQDFLDLLHIDPETPVLTLPVKTKSKRTRVAKVVRFVFKPDAETTLTYYRRVKTV